MCRRIFNSAWPRWVLTMRNSHLWIPKFACFTSSKLKNLNITSTVSTVTRMSPKLSLMFPMFHFCQLLALLLEINRGRILCYLYSCIVAVGLCTIQDDWFPLQSLWEILSVLIGSNTSLDSTFHLSCSLICLELIHFRIEIGPYIDGILPKLFFTGSS